MNGKLRPIHLSLPMQLLRARESAMAQFRPMLRAHDLTEQQWRVIRVLAAEEASAKNSVDASELADTCFLLPPSLSRILQALQRDGLVQRRLDPNDQRRSFISLTPKGRRKFRAVSPDSEALYQDIEQQFGGRRLDQLYQLLEELSSTLSPGLSGS